MAQTDSSMQAGTAQISIPVFANRYHPGAAKGGSSVPQVELLEAMEEPWNTDAHAPCYSLPGGQSCQRLNARSPPREARLVCAQMDWDRKPHVPWRDKAQAMAWLAEFQRADLSWSVVFSTRKGARAVFLFSTPLLPQDFSSFARGILKGLPAIAGGEWDDTCTQWSRIYRLPFVMRDGTPTWEDPGFFVVRPEQVVNNRLIIPVSKEYIPQEGTTSLPKEEDVDRWLADKDFISRAQRLLTTGQLWRACFHDEHFIAKEGKRDQQLTVLSGRIVSKLHGRGFSAQQAYALLCPAADKLQPDGGTQDWRSVLWDKIFRFWSDEDRKKDDGRKTTQRAQTIEVIDTSDDLPSQILAGMRKWCESVPSPEKNGSGLAWLMNRCIVATGRLYHVIRRDGKYDKSGVPKDLLIARIRALGMDKLIPLRQPTANGGFKERSIQSIVNSHCTIVSTIMGVPGQDGAIVKDMDSQDPHLLVGLWRKRDIQPERSTDVEAWLRNFAGVKEKELLRWLAWAVYPEDGPICALSIVSPRASGKKLLVRGLLECFTAISPATATDLVGRFRPGLLRSPILVVDEGWPTGTPYHNPSDSFRDIVAGTLIAVDTKFRDPITITAAMRVIITANNLDAVGQLAAGRSMSVEGRRAIEQRLLHLELGERGSRFLRGRGGRKLTKGWIAGDSGETSNYIIAKHFLWLGLRRKEMGRDSRLLVEGKIGGQLMDRLLMADSLVPVVIEAIIKLLDRPSGQQVRGFSVVDGKLSLLVSTIMDWIRNSAKIRTASARQVSRALANLALTTKLKNIEDQGIGKQKWIEMDTERVDSIARSLGLGNKAIAKLAETQTLRRLTEMQAEGLLRNPQDPPLSGKK